MKRLEKDERCPALIMWGPTKKLGLIGSAILTFIGYKQTNKQTDRQAKYISIKIILSKCLNLRSWEQVTNTDLKEFKNSSNFVMIYNLF